MSTTQEGEDKPKPRRARGEGGLFWDENRQRWIAKKIVGYDARGKPITRKGSGTSKTAALNNLHKRVKDYEAGLVTGSERVTVAEAMADWLEFGLPGATSDATREKYRILVDKHITTNLGGRRLRDLQAGEVDRWLKKLAPQLSTRTLQEVRSYLNRAIVRAQARGIVERNVVALCAVPSGKPGRPSKALTLQQAKDVLTTTKDDPLHAYIVVSLLTGARTEELRALTWPNVQLASDPEADPPVVPYMQVWHSVRKGGDTKTRKSRRTLALPKLAVQVLKDHKLAQAEKRRRATRWEDPDLVFPTRSGTKMDAHNVRRSFRNALKNVPGIEPKDWTPREMRHSFVSVLSAHGVRLEDIAQLVGHEGGSQVTEKVYRKQIRPVIQTGAQAMDEIFSCEDDTDEESPHDEVQDRPPEDT